LTAFSNSEERISRLLYEVNDLKSELRQRDRDLQLMRERLQITNEELAVKERELKGTALGQEEVSRMEDRAQRAVQMLEQRCRESEEKALEEVMLRKDREGAIKALEVRMEQVRAEAEEAKRREDVRDEEAREMRT